MWAIVRRTRAAALLLAGLALLPAPAATRAGSTGTVTFVLTLRGDVVAADSFSLGIGVPSTDLVVDPGFLCGPPDNIYTEAGPICESSTYSFATTLPVGTVLEYTYARNPDYDGDAEGAIILLRGTIRVAEQPQTRTLVYDYSLGSPGNLPDAAMHGGASLPGTGLPAVAGVLLLLLLPRRLRPDTTARQDLPSSEAHRIGHAAHGRPAPWLAPHHNGRAPANSTGLPKATST